MFEKLDQDRKIVAEAFMAYEVFGIDPGASGAIYKYIPNQPDIVLPMFKKFEEMTAYFREQKRICKLPMAFIEHQNLRKGDKDGIQFGIEKLLINYSELISALKLSGIPFVRVHPATWQSYLRIPKIPKEDKKERKKRYRDIAAGYNAVIRPALWNCDAILIGQFGIKKIVHDPSYINEFKEIGKSTNKNIE